ncbi:MAG: tRNA (uridine(34)/cytosine(34)/5-carboxymethylaminomethyluridine(34)-2'-O)-methyltransferase TrmL [Candidatus Borkfalkiaceae bacterium]|nr:tRNA (uridine(34)/cytosine(34)/5-carboxymethylaminomethyluridine(34)-2'-O)-methyltransferase TrmL [Christensenellaceae bacterium]
MFNIVLVEPEIPQNTGNISRTCAATHTALHLVRPLGFEISDRTLKRAGLDYWQYLSVSYYDSFSEILEKYYNGKNFYFLSTKGKKRYVDVSFHDGDFLIFGKESHGLPEPLLKDHYEETLRIPMWQDLRSLNLSNSVAITLYEALRQTGFSELNPEGHLTGRSD